MLSKNEDESKLKAKGYWPGAETNNFRLWFNDDDECIVVERSKDDEASSNSKRPGAAGRRGP